MWASVEQRGPQTGYYGITSEVEKLYLYSPVSEMLQSTKNSNGISPFHTLTTAVKVDPDDITLHEAAKSCNWNVFVDQLALLNPKKRSKHGKLNILDNDGLASIHYICRQGNDKALQLLLQYAEIDVNLKTGEGSTALHLATRNRSKECVSLLISAGANLTLLDEKGKSALHIAARKGCIDTLEVLVRAIGRDIDMRDRERMTALHEAVHSESTKACQLLIDAGAELFVKDISDQTPLILACMDKNVDIVKMLVNSEKSPLAKLEYLHHRDNEGAAALHLAVQNKKLENMKVLLEAGVNVNLSKSNGSIALDMAATFGFDEIMDVLLSNGADIHNKDSVGMSAIHRTALFDTVTCAEVLNNHGADLNALNYGKRTPIHCAALKGNSDVFNYLLEQMVDLTLSDERQRNVLHFAVLGANLECVEPVIHFADEESFKALLNGKDDNQQTALHYAAQLGNLNILNTLLTLGAHPEHRDEQDKTPLHLAAEYGHAKCVEALFLHSKAEINDDDIEGRTPLLLACMNGHYNCIKHLLRFGGDVSARSRDEFNHSALTLAACHGHTEIVDLLLENQSNIEVFTKNKDTALHLACQNNHVKTVELLLNKSALLTARNINNETPLDVAIASQSTEAAFAIVQSDRWEEAISCLDSKCHNAMPRLIAFMPGVAQIVLDKCVVREGDPQDESFQVNYNFKYIDINPRDKPKSKKTWYVNDMIEHNCDDMLMHELVQKNITYKWLRFGRSSHWVDFSYFAINLVVLSVYITTVPVIGANPLDMHGCPIEATAEELNDTELMNKYFQEGKRNNLTDTEWQIITSLQYAIIGLLWGSILRIIINILVFRLAFFANPVNYMTFAMMVSVQFFLFPVGELPCVFSWRAGWISILLAWLNTMVYIMRFQSVGLYVLMFGKVVTSVVKVLSILFLFMVAFAYCFYIILPREAEFTSVDISFLAVFTMGLGELSFVDRLIDKNTHPFRTDSLILFALFCVIVPISLMNLLIGIAVGDIDSIQSRSKLRLVALRVSAIYEYEANYPKTLQRYLYRGFITESPNVLSRHCFLWGKRYFGKKLKRAAFERSSAFILRSQVPSQDGPDYVNLLERQQKQINSLHDIVERQNELLLAIANKVGAELDTRGKLVIERQKSAHIKR